MNLTVLITAIGSLSSEAVISGLRRWGAGRLVGCDTHPGEWLATKRYVDAFHRVASCLDEETYVKQVLAVISSENVGWIVPLTDPEVDVIARHRAIFLDRGAWPCIPSDEALNLSRDKLAFHDRFVDTGDIGVIPTQLLSHEPPNWPFPWLIKPRKGRSSEGQLWVTDESEYVFYVSRLKHCDFIIQPLFSESDVFVVDVVRDGKTGDVATIGRQELMRTVNGAGTTVGICTDSVLKELAVAVAAEIDVHGCINIEFLKVHGCYLLMDINPRFSAGVSFSVHAGYDMVGNHMRCHMGQFIEPLKPISTALYARRYREFFLHNGVLP